MHRAKCRPVAEALGARVGGPDGDDGHVAASFCAFDDRRWPTIETNASHKRREGGAVGVAARFEQKREIAGMLSLHRKPLSLDERDISERGGGTYEMNASSDRAP